MEENDEIPTELSTPKRESSQQCNYKSVVPWRNAKEFGKVHKCLYSESISDKLWATDAISVWETRCHYALPAAIEATWGLTKAVLHDMMAEQGATFCREGDLQNLYAMSIVKFVNLAIEKEAREKNLTVLADKYNIPRWIVELRHDATHAKTPSLPLLRMGAKVALQHLDDIYWKVEVALVCPIVKKPSNLEACSARLKEFKTEQSHIFGIANEKAKNLTKKEVEQRERDVTIIIKKIHSLVMKNKEKFVETLVKPGVFLNEKEIGQLEDVKDPNFLRNCAKTGVFPEKFIKFWLPIFKVLHKHELILTFVEMLLLSLEQVQSPVCHKMAAAIVMYFIKASLPNGEMSDLRVRFKAKGVLMDVNRLLYVSMRAANPSTGHLFDEIVKTYHGDSEDCSDLYLVVLPRLGMIPSKVDEPKAEQKEDEAFVFTVDDLENDIEEVTRKRKKRRVENNKWSMAPVSMNFSEMPLGTILNPVPEESIDESEDIKNVEEEIEICDKSYDPVEVEDPESNILEDPEIGDMIYTRVMRQ